MNQLRIISEEQLLDESIRKQIIEEIEGPEENRRRAEQYKRDQIYKDKGFRWVVENLLHMFDTDTVKEMQYAISNINFLKKMINKLATVYNQGVVRKVVFDGEVNDQETAKVNNLEKVLKFNSNMKKTNRLLKQCLNVLCYVKPHKIEDKFGVKLEPLSPHLYSVIEEPNDREKPLAVILSNYNSDQTTYVIGDAAVRPKEPQIMAKSDGKDQAIADAKEDIEKENKRYIWWSNSYHFTTDGRGKIVSVDGPSREVGVANPIGELPFVNFAIDQDGNFWAEGGDDKVMGCILLNSLITNTNHIGITQGYGQLWMKGKRVPSYLKIGPNSVIRMEYEEGEPEPGIGYATSNPPLDELMNLVKIYAALLLSTNNLSTSGVKAELNGGMDFPSGIAMLFDKAESLEDVADQRSIFVDEEINIWRKVNAWLLFFKATGSIAEAFEENILPEGFEMTHQFAEPTPIMAESEKLNNLKLRKELGIDRMIDLIKRDNPTFTEQEAEAKLQLILEEKIANAAKFGLPENPADKNSENSNKPTDEDNADNKDERDGEQDNE
jgi:hypothetical protein